MRRKLVLLLLTCFLLSWQVSASDWDFDYNGVVEDPEPTVVSGTTAQEDKGYVQVSEDCWYDYERHAFVSAAGGSEIYSSVANGMVTCDEVTVKVSGGTTAYLYLDGNQVSAGSQFEVSEPGAYVLSLNVNGMSKEPLKFTILSSISGKLNQYRLPGGFYFDEVTLDGEPYLWSGSTLNLTQEGDYRITYICRETRMVYSLTLTVDHTPPTLALEAVKDGEANGPVDISDVEPGARVYVTRNGDSVSYSGTLTSSGRYEVNVVDQAGNVQTYNFIIRTYFNGSAVGFLVLLIAMLAGLCVYLVMSRRNLRVR